LDRPIQGVFLLRKVAENYYQEHVLSGILITLESTTKWLLYDQYFQKPN
jgi:hypothetical protein